MDEKSKRDVKFPCPDKNNKYTTIYDCEHYCRKSPTCDIYLSMADEDM